MKNEREVYEYANRSKLTYFYGQHTKYKNIQNIHLEMAEETTIAQAAPLELLPDSHSAHIDVKHKSQ